MTLRVRFRGSNFLPILTRKNAYEVIKDFSVSNNIRFEEQRTGAANGIPIPAVLKDSKHLNGVKVPWGYRAGGNSSSREILMKSRILGRLTMTFFCADIVLYLALFSDI